MVWIRIDEDFPDHPKLFLLESRLECFSEDTDTPSKADALEVVFRLFKLAMKVDPVHGELTKYRNQIEKLICGCRVFGPSVATLVEVGFVDRREDGRIYVHDWWEVNGKHVQKLISDRERKRAAYSEERGRRIPGDSNTIPEETPRKIPGDSADNPGNRGVNGTVRNGTLRNATETETDPTPKRENEDNPTSPKKEEKKKRSVFKPPTVEEVQEYIAEKGLEVIPEIFIDFYESKGWMVGKNKMKDWRASCRRSRDWDQMIRAWAERRRQYGGASPDADGEWLYECYRREDMNNFGNHSMWESYVEASADFPERSAPKFETWLDMQMEA